MSCYMKLVTWIGWLVLCGAWSASALHAQELTLPDGGSTEPYHPGLVSFRVGIYFYDQGDYERALQEFTITTEGLPNWGIGFAARGDTYAALGQYALAIADYDRAISLYPDYVSALYTRGRAYQALGNLERAAADYTNAISQMPTYALPYWGLADALLAQGNVTSALTNYHLYVSLSEDAPNAMVLAQIEQLQLVVAMDVL